MNPATEKQCPQCDAIIAKDAEVCPDCGSAQNVPPIARKGGGGKVLKGCLIAAVVGFFGIFVLGIVAAIVIPKFANTKEKAYIAAMRIDLRNLATAEEAYHAAHGSYEANPAALGFNFGYGITLVDSIDAGKDGWSATVKRAETSTRCTMSVGDRVPTGEASGVPVCTAGAGR
ncbi:MAG: zinc ribbon domain-containing protein [Gemmatimonadaceae bacterium]